jgi:hypothetical protein
MYRPTGVNGMGARLSELDDAQEATLHAGLVEWGRRAQTTEPVDWPRWRAGAAECLRPGGPAWPRPVVRVGSPLQLARTLFLARVQEVPGDEDRALVGLVRRLTVERIERKLHAAFHPRVLARARRVVREPLEAVLPGRAISAAVEQELLDHPLTEDSDRMQHGVHNAVRRLDRPVKTAVARRPVTESWQSWRLCLGGQEDLAWCAYAAVLAGLDPGGPNQRWAAQVAALADAQAAGWWYPSMDFVLVSDRPQLVRTEPMAPGAPGRLHSATGPALVWADGWRLHFWHGTRVPAWVVQRPTVEAITAEANVEVRRCGIEAMGWDTYIAASGLRLADRAADPGNPGHELCLYDLPPAIWGEPARVLLAVNGSVERDGTRRRYGLPVPADVPDALAAAGWTYGLSAEQYARLVRRT